MTFWAVKGAPARILPNAASEDDVTALPRRLRVTPGRRGNAIAMCAAESRFSNLTTPFSGSLPAPLKRRPSIRTVAAGGTDVAPFGAALEVNVVKALGWPCRRPRRPALRSHVRQAGLDREGQRLMGRVAGDRGAPLHG